MSDKLFLIGTKRRFSTLLFLLLVTCVTGIGLLFLQVDTGFKSLISDTDSAKPLYDQITREFGSDNQTTIYIRDKHLWSPEKLAELEKLHYALEKLEFVERVDDLFCMRSIRAVEGKIVTKIFLPEAPKDQKTADEAKADALYNPLIVENFISADATVTAVKVTVSDNTGKKGFDRHVNDGIEKTLNAFKPAFEEIFQVGPPRINSELKTILINDLKILGPLSALVIILAIIFVLQSGFAAVIPVITSALSIIWTFGMMGWAGIPLNILSAMLPSLIIVIGSTESTHLFATYFRATSDAEEDIRAFATRFMMKRMGIPIVLTALTTAVGFASNIFSGIGLIRHFALSATFAILANGLINLLFVPFATGMLGPRKPRLFKTDREPTGLPGVFVRLFSFSRHQIPASLLIVTAILCVFFVYYASKLYVTNDPLSYFKQEQPLVLQAQKIQKDLSGMKLFYITLESNQHKAFQQPANLKKLLAIQDFLKKQGIFDRSISLADHLALVNREFHGGNTDYYTLPRRRELVAQYLLFFHQRDLKKFISHDFRRANIIVHHNVSDSSILNQHIRELEGVVSHIAGENMKTYIVGENLMINAAAESLIVAQVKSLVILLSVIFLIMSIMFTSLRGGLIAMIPNLIPIILMFGVMGFFNIPLNPGTAMVAVIAIGLAVDGTIHLFSRYNELCRQTSDYEQAILTTVREEAVPLVATSLALCLGFGILLKSNFTIVAQFGALAAATILFALFSNLLITPIIMSKTRLVGLHQILALTMRKEILAKSPLFEGMSNYQIRKTILITELRQFNEGELLVEQGSIGRSMFLILSGRVEVLRRTNGQSKQVAVLTTGEFFGEVGYIEETLRTADVKALTPVEALRFDYEKCKKDLIFFPYIVAKLNLNISRVLGERLADVLNQLDKNVKS